jgi:hypothetical protein
MPKLPTTLYAKSESDDGNVYYVTDTNMYNLAESGEKIQIEKYQLIETVVAEMVVSTSRPTKRN